MKLNYNQLKYIALITMTIDHIGYLLFPKVLVLRIIGRLAFPIYAYFIAQGIRYTSNEWKYLFRMIFFAAITQIAFYIVKIDFVNVMVTFSLAIIGLMSIRRKQYWLAIFVLLPAYYLNSDYSYFGILVVYIFYFFENRRFLRFILLMILTTFFILETNLNFNFELISQLYIYRKYNYDLILRILAEFFAWFSLPLIDMYDHEQIIYKTKTNKTVNQYFYYIYYPAHLVILKLLEGVL